MNLVNTIHGPLLNPLADGTVDFLADATLQWNDVGVITYLGNRLAAAGETSRGIILPPLIDAHIHIPQFPIRGRFSENIGTNPEGGRLLASLMRNVFPTEAKCADDSHAKKVIDDFLADTLAKGVVGGAAYMTVHTSATRLALEMLPDTWSVGLVLMNHRCPRDLCTDEINLDRDIAELAERFGRRFIVTDRFAPAVDSPLRRRAAKLAEKFGLRMQTHLNEQLSEKTIVEQMMYPDAGTYTNVYQQDGLLAREPILAHCVRMSDAEFAQVAVAPNALIAHCPTSNALLGSGIMPLDRVNAAGIPYAICTDVGASPTTSLLAEGTQFLVMHADQHAGATMSAALHGITRTPAIALGLADRLGTLAVGKQASFIEVSFAASHAKLTADDAIRSLLKFDPADVESTRVARQTLSNVGLDYGPALQQLEGFVHRIARSQDDAVQRVTFSGNTVWSR